MMSNSLSDLSYCAGIFDGEGCVTLTRDKKLTYRLRVKITSTDYVILEWLQEHFGGYINLSYKEGCNNKESWDWVCSVDNQINFLFSILPYTIIKREQIVEALNYLFEKQIGGKLTEDERALRDLYYQKLKLLK